MPLLLIVTVFTSPVVGVLLKVTPPLVKDTSVLAPFVALLLFNVNPLVPPETELILVKLGFTSNEYSFPVEPSPVNVVFVPFSNFGALAVVDTVYVF